MSELKKCPCCKGNAKLFRMSHTIENFVNKPTVVCLDCGLSIEAGSEVIAVRKWNTRKPVDDVVEALEEQAEGNKKLWDELDAVDAFGGMNAYMRAISIVKEKLNE